MKKQKKRAFRGILVAICCYAAVNVTLLGILKSTGQTRKILYGDDAALVQCTETKTVAGTAYTMQLGGGEWSFSVARSQFADISAQAADQLPPCVMKLVLRMVSLAGYYTAECISS